jgi:hypothetical protein
MGLGSKILDPEKTSPDPGSRVKKAPDLGSGSATLLTASLWAPPVGPEAAPPPQRGEGVGEWRPTYLFVLFVTTSAVQEAAALVVFRLKKRSY